MSARASVQELADATHALLAAVAYEDWPAAERALRGRDAALALLARDLVRAPLARAERALLERASRASGEAERTLAERLAHTASELAELRRARARMPSRTRESRALATV